VKFTNNRNGALKEKRLHEGGVEPEMRSPVGLFAMLPGARK